MARRTARRTFGLRSQSQAKYSKSQQEDRSRPACEINQNQKLSSTAAECHKSVPPSSNTKKHQGPCLSCMRSATRQQVRDAERWHTYTYPASGRKHSGYDGGGNTTSPRRRILPVPKMASDVQSNMSRQTRLLNQCNYPKNESISHPSRSAYTQLLLESSMAQGIARQLS